MSDAGKPLKEIALDQLKVQKKIEANTAPDGEAETPPVDRSLPATTTQQEDMTKAGQRKVNLIWEYSQAIIAIAVTTNALTVCAFLVYRGDPTNAVPAFMLLSNVFFLVIGTYFQRTNHTRIGGVGPKPAEEYFGR